ncbi:amidase [Variovorax sp. J22G73]|uniref:amidase n=1 Tax=unclassified Variovorax TaxID=663243 RepID=UPI000D5F3308|nr:MULTISPECIES: amidase [unclassified Variovorax]MDM0007249.1 amidase [Variovorax sp. J22R203]MDM0098999.1 amidase [Variovorax sp. J22G73]
MTDDTLCFTPATELAGLLRARQLSPVELVTAVLARAERLQPVLNCFVTLVPERALAEARRAEEDIVSGRPLGSLHGIPFTVKDLVNTEGVRTTFGAVIHRDNVPTEDAVSVARLRAEGAILIGKTTTPEFGSGPMTNSPLFGSTCNPWDLSRTSGGSSGGAAAATAAGIAPLAVATDGGGSTRIPAACNGVVGLKQSNGVIPHSQAQDLFGNQTYVTPMTRTVADTALMLQAMAGASAVDPWSIGLRAHDYVEAARRQGDLRGQRVLYCLSPPGRPVSRDVTEAFSAALQTLASLGATLEPFDGDGFDVEPIWRAINHTVWRARFAPLVDKHPDSFSETFRRQIASAASVSGVEYQEAMFARSALFKRVQGLFDTADLLAMPTLTRSALPLAQDLFADIDIDGQRFGNVRAHWYPWTMLFNMTGHPAVSLPCGFGRDAMPLGLQLVGRFQGDTELLQAASQFEAASDFSARRPPGL